MEFAAAQGVSMDDVMELMAQRCQKKARTIKVEIPVKESLGFFLTALTAHVAGLNSGYSCSSLE